MVPKPLTINANTAPFKSSRLAIPPSPFSPRLPITPPAMPPKIHLQRPSNKRALSSPVTPPPSAPLNWLWQCHICYRAYPLGATRRCLDDGHLFCSGTTAVTKRKSKAGRRTKRHRACASEFDYASWKSWGEWRRTENALVRLHRLDGNETDDDDDAMSVDSGYVSNGDRAILPSQHHKMADMETTLPRKKDCWNNCDYPSECRWGSQYGVQSVSSTSSASSKTTTTVVSTPPAPSHSHNGEPITSISTSTITAQLTPSPLSIHTAPETYTPPTTFDGILEGTPLASALATASASLSPTSPKDVRERFWDTLLDAARQRKRSSSVGSGGKRRGSPLATTAMNASTLPAVVEEDEPGAETETSAMDVVPTGRAVEDDDTGEMDLVDVPLFFDAFEEQPRPPQRPQEAEEDDDADLEPPAVPAPSLAYGTASSRDRGASGRAFDFGFADKVQGALAGSDSSPSPGAVVPIMSDLRGCGEEVGLSAGRSTGKGTGRRRRRLMRKSVLWV